MKTKRLLLNTGWHRIATADAPAKIRLFSEHYKHVEIHVGANQPTGGAFDDFFPMTAAADWVLLFSPSTIWARLKQNAGMDTGYISVLAPSNVPAAPPPANPIDVKP